MSPEINDNRPNKPVRILDRLRLGRLATTGVVIETAGIIGSVAAQDPALLLGASYVNAVVFGTTLHDAHNHHVNDYPTNNFFVRQRDDL